jgi:hypothetical protein
LVLSNENRGLRGFTRIQNGAFEPIVGFEKSALISEIRGCILRLPGTGAVGLRRPTEANSPVCFVRQQKSIRVN